jgi:hypothetical protein
MPNILSWDILALGSIFYFPDRKTKRLPWSRSNRTKRDRPRPPIDDYGSAGPRTVLEIAVRVHDSLPRFIQHCDNQRLMSRKSHGISTFLRQRLPTRLVSFQARNSRHAQFPNREFPIKGETQRKVLPYGVWLCLGCRIEISGVFAFWAASTCRLGPGATWSGTWFSHRP